MSYIVAIFSFVSLILLVLGFFSPKSSLFWEKNQEKRTRVKSLLVYLPLFILFEALLVIVSPDGGSKENKEATIKELNNNCIYDKDIDLNTGDTIYKTSIIGKGSPLLYYSKGNYDSIVYITFEKNGNKKQASIYLTLGEFIENDTVDIYFTSQKPEIQYTYELKSEKEAILNISNVDAFMKKINLKSGFYINLPIKKQYLGRTPFIVIYNEGKVVFEK